MSRSDDFPYEMFGSWLDQDTAERLLAGAIQPDDAPPGFGQVVRVVHRLRGPAAVHELTDERVAVAVAIRVLNDPFPAHATNRRWRMGSKLSRAKIAGLVVAGAMIGTTGMAAANVLPDVAQNAVSNALSHVGITVPHTTVDATSVDRPAATGEQISQIATTTDATGVDKGAEISTAASGGLSQAGVKGSNTSGSAAADTASSAPVDTPNTGGTGTADQASGDADQTGSSTADQASDGHADAGSGNAPTPPPTP